MYLINILLFLTATLLSNLDVDELNLFINPIYKEFNYQKFYHSLYSHDLFSDYLFLISDLMFLINEIVFLYNINNYTIRSVTYNPFIPHKLTENVKRNFFNSITDLEQNIISRKEFSKEIINDYDITKTIFQNFVKELKQDLDEKPLNIFYFSLEDVLHCLIENIEFYTFIREKINLKNNTTEKDYLDDLSKTCIKIFNKESMFNSYVLEYPFKGEWQSIDTLNFYKQNKNIKLKSKSDKFEKGRNKIKIFSEKVKDEKNFDHIINIKDFIESNNINIFLKLLFTVILLCCSSIDIETLSHFNLNNIIFFTPDDKNIKEFYYLYLRIFEEIKNFFTDDNLEKFFDKNLKNKSDSRRILCLMRPEVANLIEIKKQYYVNDVYKLKKIENAKNKKRNEIEKKFYFFYRFFLQIF